MVFNARSRNLNDHKIYLNGNELELFKEFTYLDIDGALNNSFSIVVSIFKDKVNKAMVTLNKFYIKI